MQAQTKPQHTPGPWQVASHHARGYGATITRENGAHSEAVVDVVDFNDYHRDAEVAANARLIAAAPEMLKALKNTLRALVQHIEDGAKRDGISLDQLAQLCPCWDEEVQEARAAIAKATAP